MVGDEADVTYTSCLNDIGSWAVASAYQQTTTITTRARKISQSTGPLSRSFAAKFPWQTKRKLIVLPAKAQAKAKAAKHKVAIEHTTPAHAFDAGDNKRGADLPYQLKFLVISKRVGVHKLGILLLGWVFTNWCKIRLATKVVILWKAWWADKKRHTIADCLQLGFKAEADFWLSLDNFVLIITS